LSPPARFQLAEMRERARFDRLSLRKMLPLMRTAILASAGTAATFWGAG
jgi:hypothetical protein